MSMDQQTTGLLHVDSVGSDPPKTEGVSTLLGKLLSLKVLVVVFAVMSLILLIISVVLDAYILTHSSTTMNFSRLSVDIVLPDSVIGADRVVLRDIAGEHVYTYVDMVGYVQKHIDDKSAETFLASDLVASLGFRLPIPTIEYAAGAGHFVSAFEIFSVICTSAAILVQLIFRRVPDSFILRPGVSARVSTAEKLKSGLPGFCLLLSSMSSMLHAVVVSSYVHNFVYRIVVGSIINSSIDGGYLADFRTGMIGNTVAAKQDQLRFMQFVGKYLTNKEAVSFGYSFYALIFSMVLNVIVIFALYYRDNSISRQQHLDVSKLPEQAPQTDVWSILPWHCRVRPILVSVGIFFFGLAVTAVGGNVARRRGVKMNRHPFEVEGVPVSFIDDVVISHTSDYFFSTAGLVDGAVMIFMPLLVMVVISSYDRIKFLSKILELLGIIFFMRGISVMATIMPTLFNVLQHPQCWDHPSTKFMDMVMEKEFCNDLMFSGHTVFCLFPALIFVFSIVHGPYRYKPVIVLTVLLTAISLTSLIVFGRLHYTADVIVAMTITSLLVVMNAPFWKLQFSFRKSQFGVGSASAIDKVPSYLELCIERLNLFAVTVEQTPSGMTEEGKHADTWACVSLVYTQLGQLIDEAQAETLREIVDYDDTEGDEVKPLLVRQSSQE